MYQQTQQFLQGQNIKYIEYIEYIEYGWWS
jgi:hypothetical protein